jgi:hypothetical protein
LICPFHVTAILAFLHVKIKVYGAWLKLKLWKREVFEKRVVEKRKMYI